MARKIINISVPETLHFFVDYRVRTGGYASISEYFRELLRNDERLEQARLTESARSRPVSDGFRHPGNGHRNY